MPKILFSHIGEYKKSTLIAPIFIALEAILEMLIPTLMASIIDLGLNKGDMSFTVKVGSFTLVIAMVSLTAGILAGRYASHASAGFAKNLRWAMFNKIQQYSFTNIYKLSTDGLITCHSNF